MLFVEGKEKFNLLNRINLNTPKAVIEANGILIPDSFSTYETFYLPLKYPVCALVFCNQQEHDIEAYYGYANDVQMYADITNPANVGCDQAGKFAVIIGETNELSLSKQQTKELIALLKTRMKSISKN